MSKQLETANHGQMIRKTKAQYSWRFGELTLTQNCLFFEVRDINFPVRVRNLHVPLEEIFAVESSSSLGRNSFLITSRDGHRYEFTVYGGFPIDILPLYSSEREEWIESLRTAVSQYDGSQCEYRGSTDRDPRRTILALWISVSALVVVALAVAGMDFELISIALGISALALVIVLLSVRSG